MTLIEMLVVLGVLGVILGIAALNLRPLGGDLDSAANNLAGLIRQGRSKAMATTSAYSLVLPESGAREFIFERGNNNCRFETSPPEGYWTPDQKLKFTLPANVELTGVDGAGSGQWLLCFNSRGISSSTPKLTLTDDRGVSRALQVFAGGMVEIE